MQRPAPVRSWDLRGHVLRSPHHAVRRAAAMDIATNGENAALKYQNNAEVMDYLRKLEELMSK